MVFA
ncbi:bacterial extracellular solute-binding s, 5 Middle family protein, partial [Vibrio parahaemolyticus V-223/04]|jgi:hypothetical protein